MRPYLRVANVFDDRIDLSDVKTMNFEPHEFESYRLSDGDILLNEGQSLELVGRAALYRNQLPDACFQNTLVRFRAHDGLSPRFALAVFRHYFFSGRFQKIARWTTSIAHLGADRFASLEFPLPPLAEQERIVAEVERRLSVIDQMEAALRDNLKRADRLRQAVLRDAFAGKLVPQDPNDEPASVLLERIRAERAAAEAAGKTVRTRTARTATTTNGAEVPKKSRGRSAGTKTVPDDSAPLSLFSDENTPGAATGSVQTAVEFPDTAGVAA